jgi:hypothetical protein
MDDIYWRMYNKQVSIIGLLEEAGVYHGHNMIYCPFHLDEMTGKKSAVVIPESNIVYCFSERKSFRPKDVLNLLPGRSSSALPMVGSAEWCPPVMRPALMITDEDTFDVSKGRKGIYDLYLEKVPVAAARINEHIRRKLSILTALYYEVL